MSTYFSPLISCFRPHYFSSINSNSSTMGGFGIIEDRPTPKEVYNWRIYFFAAVACMSHPCLNRLNPPLKTPLTLGFVFHTATGAMVFGYDGAFFGTTLARASFQTHFGITAMSKADQTNTSANLTSSYLAAAFFGALFCWPLMEIRGRRMAIQVASLVFSVGAIIMTAASHQLGMICE